MESRDLDGSSQRLPMSVPTGCRSRGKTTSVDDAIQQLLWSRSRVLIDEFCIHHNVATHGKDNVVIEMPGGGLRRTVRGDVVKTPRGAHGRGRVARSRPLPEADGGAFCIERQGRPRCGETRQ